jgi:hypothetical protein
MKYQLLKHINEHVLVTTYYVSTEDKNIVLRYHNSHGCFHANLGTLCLCINNSFDDYETVNMKSCYNNPEILAEFNTIEEFRESMCEYII